MTIIMDILALLREIDKYFIKNRFVLVFFLFSFLLGATNLFGLSDEPIHKSWIIVSLFFTFFYTIVFHGAGFKNGYFEDFGAIKTAILILTNIFLFVVAFIISNEFHGVFRYTPKRETALALITLCFFTYAVINWIIHRHFSSKGEKELAADFKYTVFVSDLPITISFLFLFLYSLFINRMIEMNCETTEIGEVIDGFEYFFSGAIAFQIMYSNAIWIFNDDKFFKKLDGLKKEKLCQSVDSTKKC